MRPSLPPFLLLLALLLAVGATDAACEPDSARQALTRLKRALKSEDADERFEAVRDIGRYTAQLSPAQRRTAAVSIKKALPGERDARVQETMMRSMGRLGGPTGWVPVILAWLEGRDESLRKAARQALLWGGGDYLEVVGRLLREDKDPSFRARLLLLVGDRRRLDGVPLLLAGLGDDHVRVQAAAAEALEATTGELLGYDAEAWSSWWEKEGKLRARPKPAVDPKAETRTVTAERTYPEPEPHVTRSLVPSFYGLPITAKDIVFVLDISGSVGAGGVTRAKKELIRAVERLGSDVNVAAIFFDETIHLWKPEMVPATPAHKAELSLFLRGIKRGKKTDVFTPLNAGLQIVRRRLAALQAAGGPIREAVTMVVVSDGVETSAVTPPRVVADKLDRLDPRHTVVHAVALGGKGSRLLAELARRGGGHYVQAR